MSTSDPFPTINDIQDWFNDGCPDIENERLEAFYQQKKDEFLQFASTAGDFSELILNGVPTDKWKHELTVLLMVMIRKSKKVRLKNFVAEKKISEGMLLFDSSLNGATYFLNEFFDDVLAATNEQNENKIENLRKKTLAIIPLLNFDKVV